MFTLKIITTFTTNTEEQATYISKLYQDLHTVVQCENSTNSYTLSATAVSDDKSLSALLYAHREKNLVCYDHPGYCCSCGAQGMLSYNEHMTRVLNEFYSQKSPYER